MIKGGKARDLRGKKTERVSDKLTMNNHGTIHTEEFKFDEQLVDTQRMDKEQVKGCHINEENESEVDNGTENYSASKKSVIQQDTSSNAAAALDASNREEPILIPSSPQSAANDDPERNLPAQATEIQPPELGAGANDNMDTI